VYLSTHEMEDRVASYNSLLCSRFDPRPGKIETRVYLESTRWHPCIRMEIRMDKIRTNHAMLAQHQ
jgi:hypothetical protein